MIFSLSHHSFHSALSLNCSIESVRHICNPIIYDPTMNAYLIQRLGLLHTQCSSRDHPRDGGHGEIEQGLGVGEDVRGVRGERLQMLLVCFGI